MSAAQREAPVIVNYEDSSNQRKLNQMFELDTLGISESDSVHETFLKDVKCENNHYVVSLPWREHHDTLPDDKYELCVGRLKSTLRRLRKNPLLLDKYHKAIQDQIEAGIIEEVKSHLQESIPLKEPCRTHYLSHHGVVREEAVTTKLRVVFDGSAKVKPDAPSLNECLYTGPSFLPTITDILLHFRYHWVALVVDIEKAFHMLRVSDQDKDSLRFLWVNDPYSEDLELFVFRFLRVIFGLNCSPFLLGASLNHHIRKYELEDATFVRALLESLYVDDMISGNNEVNSAF